MTYKIWRKFRNRNKYKLIPYTFNAHFLDYTVSEKSVTANVLE